MQIMSMGSGLCIPPMMLPTMMQNIMCAPPHLTHFSPMGCNPGQFPTSDLPGITGTRFQMIGFPMSVSHPPFVPFVGMPSTQSVAAPGIHGAEPPPLRNINQYDSNQKWWRILQTHNAQRSKHQSIQVAFFFFFLFPFMYEREAAARQDMHPNQLREVNMKYRTEFQINIEMIRLVLSPKICKRASSLIG
jgi:hypothetical protein